MTTWNTTQMKLNPTGVVGATALHFPGFMKIADYTCTGSDSSLNVTVASDTDIEYIIYIRNLKANTIGLRFNSDSGSNYGYQYLSDNAGTMTAARSSATSILAFDFDGLGTNIIKVMAPSGIVKTAFSSMLSYTSGTTISLLLDLAQVWNSTAQITALNLYSTSGNFTANSRITVYKRVS